MAKKLFSKHSPLYSFDGLLILLLFIFLILSIFPIPYDIDSYSIAFISIIATIPVLWSGIKAATKGIVTVDFLAAVALIASLYFHEWLSAAFINLMLASARVFSNYTDREARRAISALAKMRPEKVRIKEGGDMSGSIKEIDAKDVKVGDIIVLESGDRVPSDGKVVQGEAEIDQSSLTGESLPVEKTKGDEVLSSTLLISGSLLVEVLKVGSETTLERMIRLVEDSEKEKSDIATLGDKFASYYIVGMVLVAGLAYFFTKDFKITLSLLLVACADDIAVAVPLAYLAAVGYMARHGVIIKGAKFLDGLAHLTTVVVDKTGTLTRGRAKLVSIFLTGEMKEEDVIRLSVGAEAVSNHPIARSFIRFAKEKKISIPEVSQFNEIPGKGMLVKIENKDVIIGKTSFLHERGIEIPDETRLHIKEREKEAESATAMAVNGKLEAVFFLMDELRPHAKEVIAKLKDLGVKKVVMLTGDNNEAARRVAEDLDIDEVHANLLPETKISHLKSYLGKGGSLAMIGDGTNDAAAITLADIGIAMGAIGSDAAIESADVALMRDDLKELPRVVEVAHLVKRIVLENFAIWGVVNVVGVILVFGKVIGPEGAAAYNFLTDFIPLINSLRLFNLHIRDKDIYSIGSKV